MFRHADRAFYAGRIPVAVGDCSRDALCNRAVFVIADDGWKSIVEKALAEMDLPRVPCTLFVIADRLGETPSAPYRIISKGERRALRFVDGRGAPRVACAARGHNFYQERDLGIDWFSDCSDHVDQ